mmetsp:Transcript_56090/g.175811  ORF Transcript_56090/g.175811 Transcript_56090/m.175811 type:complete len:684 (-) Transcript_56090:29-2080(-)
MPDTHWSEGRRSSYSGHGQGGGGTLGLSSTQALRGVPPPTRPQLFGELPPTIRSFPEVQPLMEQEASDRGSSWAWALGSLLPLGRLGGGAGHQEAVRGRRGSHSNGGGKGSWLTSAADLLPDFGDQWWQNPRVIAFCLLVAAIATLLVALSQPQAPRPGGPQPQLPLPGPSFGPGGTSIRWLVCQAPGQCERPRLERWSVSPQALASQVTDFSTIPSIQPEAYKPVADRWAQAPPYFRGTPVTLAGIADFVRALLSSDPFGLGDEVPFVDLRPPGEGKVVVISQRQLAFLVANALMGNTVPAGNGLLALLQRCSAKGTTGFLYSLLSFLAVLSTELGPGEQGRMLIGATPRAMDDGWRQRLTSSTLQTPTICVQQPGGGTDCGLPDFMSGGTSHQALTDIAGGVVGGGAQLCDIADSQDESVVQFYSEVLAFSFFASADPSMLPVPFALLGARRYLRDITGESAPGAKCGSVSAQNWLNEEIPTETVVAKVHGTDMMMSATAFVAVASACTACIAGDSCSLGDSMNNQCDLQRRHLDDDLGRWYQAYEPTMYDTSVQEAFRSVIKRIGTGPWGAGVWYGDSQQYFLAVWLATSLLSGTSLDYYAYDHFCENPGNQCFILGSGGCESCITKSGVAGQVDAAFCGQTGYQDMVQRFQNMPAQALYAALKTVGPPPKQVFDYLATA